MFKVVILRVLNEAPFSHNLMFIDKHNPSTLYCNYRPDEDDKARNKFSGYSTLRCRTAFQKHQSADTPPIITGKHYDPIFTDLTAMT